MDPLTMAIMVGGTGILTSMISGKMNADAQRDAVQGMNAQQLRMYQLQMKQLNNKLQQYGDAIKGKEVVFNVFPRKELTDQAIQLQDKYLKLQQDAQNVRAKGGPGSSLVADSLQTMAKRAKQELDTFVGENAERQVRKEPGAAEQLQQMYQDAENMWENVKATEQGYGEIGGLAGSMKGLTDEFQASTLANTAQYALESGDIQAMQSAINQIGQMSAAELQDSGEIELIKQRALSEVLEDRAAGRTPSIAKQKLLLALDRATKQQAGLAAQQRGGMNTALAQRNVARMGQEAMQGASREGAILAAEERERAEQALGGQLAGMRQVSTQRDVTQAGFDQEAAARNLAARQDAARQQQGLAGIKLNSLGQLMRADTFNATQQQALDMAKMQARANAIADQARAKQQIDAGNIAAARGLQQQRIGEDIRLRDAALGAERMGIMADADLAKMALGQQVELPQLQQAPVYNPGAQVFGNIAATTNRIAGKMLENELVKK